MRYWIYWNDLVQGPFELDELSALKALSEDLPVCLEDRTDWIPACRIADLAPIIEQLRSSRMPPPPPPPPPSGPPARSALQGELFTDPPEQETLFFESEVPKGPFALSDTDAQMKTGLYADVRVTAPFRFQSGEFRAPSFVEAPPRRQPAAEPYALYPAPVVETPRAPLTKQSPVPDIQDAAFDLPVRAHIPLEIYPDAPEVLDAPAAAAAAPKKTAEPSVLPGLPPLHIEPTSDSSAARLIAWTAGVLLACMLMGSVGYKLFDLSTSRAAIAEARRRMPAKNTASPIVTVTETVSAPVSSSHAPERATPGAAANFFHWLKAKLTRTPHAVSNNPASSTGPKVPAESAPNNGPVPTASPATAATPGAVPSIMLPQPAARIPASGTPSTMSPESVKPTVRPAKKTIPKKKITKVIAGNRKAQKKVPQKAHSRLPPVASASVAAAGAEREIVLPAAGADVAPMTHSGSEASEPSHVAGPNAAGSNAAAPAAAKSAVKKSPFSKIGGLFKPHAPIPVPVTAPVPVPLPVPVAAAAAPTTFSPLAAPAAGESTTAASAVPGAPDQWLGKHNEAITLVMNRKIAATPQTVDARSRVMLEEMHDKELLNAADTGQRLFLPDKIAWSALREAGPLYRVYLNFSALQGNGERIQSLSYQFEAELAKRIVISDDAAAQNDFMNAKTILVHKREQRAADIENILSAVDHLNKQLMRAIIVKKSHKNRVEDKKIDESIKKAVDRLQRALGYFRTKYPETMLDNIAHAYDFVELLKGHV